MTSGGSEASFIPNGRQGLQTKSRDQIFGVSADWVYYRISNAMQNSNTALETTSLVMYDTKSFSYVLPLFLRALRTS